MSKLSYCQTLVKTVFLPALMLLQTDVVKAQSSYGVVAGYGKSSLAKIQGPKENINKYSSTSYFSGGLRAAFPFGENGLGLSGKPSIPKKVMASIFRIQPVPITASKIPPFLKALITLMLT